MLEVCARMDSLLAQADVAAGGASKDLARYLAAQRSQLVFGGSGLDADPQAPTVDSGRQEVPRGRVADRGKSGDLERPRTPLPISLPRLRAGERPRWAWLLAGLLVLALLSALAVARLLGRRQPVVAAAGETPAPAPAAPAPAAAPAAPALPALAPSPPDLSAALTARQSPPRPIKPRPGAKRTAGAGTVASPPPDDDALEEPWR